jgi:hypothetical protein
MDVVGVSVASAQVIMSPVVVGSRMRDSASLVNTGASSIILENAWFLPPTPSFTVLSTFPKVIGPLDSTAIVFEYHPLSIGRDSAVLHGVVGVPCPDTIADWIRSISIQPELDICFDSVLTVRRGDSVRLGIYLSSGGYGMRIDSLRIGVKYDSTLVYPMTLAVEEGTGSMNIVSPGMLELKLLARTVDPLPTRVASISLLALTARDSVSAIRIDTAIASPGPVIISTCAARIDQIGACGGSGQFLIGQGVGTAEVYPVPANRQVLVSVERLAPSRVAIRLLDCYSRVVADVYSGVVSRGRTVLRFVLPESIPSGMYALEIREEGRDFRRLVVIDR